MLNTVLYASDFMDKDVLNLDNGDLVGRITGMLMATSPLRVVAFAYRMEDEEKARLAFCDLSLVTDVDQHVVVISGSQAYLPGDVKSVLGLSCLDASGKLLGKIRDCAWTRADGHVTELIVSGQTGSYGVAVSDVGKLGSGAVILNVAEENMHKSGYQRAQNASENSEDMEEMMRGLIRRVGATLSEAGQKVGERVKQIDTEELNRDINRFTERVGKEIRNVIDNISEQSKSSKYANMQSEIISVLRDLDGFTVSSPIYDREGELIILPGYAIDENVVRRVIESDKLAELYRVAVSIKTQEGREEHE